MSTTTTREGAIPFTVQGETYFTWYKVHGNFPSSRRPLVVLHGGPGTSHDYMIPLADLALRDSPIPVIFYDQLGTARSKHPDLLKKDSLFWTIDLFVAELENLLTRLNISHAFDLLGHSWGATLAAEFIVRRQPPGITRLVLSNALASAKLRNNSIARLRELLPASVQETLRINEEARTTNTSEYKLAMQTFHENFGCRIKPAPEEVTFSLDQVELEGRVVSKGIRDNGMANDWTIVDRIRLIHTPTLLINGKYDFMSDEACMPFFLLLRKVKWVQFPSSSHVPQWEERERYVSVVSSFLFSN